MTKNRWVVLIGFFLFAAALFYIFSYSSQETTASQHKIESISDTGYAFGNETAPVKIVEFSNFECPSCQKSHQEIKEALKQAIDSGAVYYIFKHTSLDQFTKSPLVSERVASLEDDETKPEVMDQIFQEQQSWSKLNEKELIEYLEEMNLTQAVDLEEERATIQEETKELNVSGTPTIFVNDKKVQGALTEKAFKKLLQSSLE
ncbi:thioredoxin domain-containing protein [Halobacillus sp. Marseille-Q1614]|uniref:thioredoxin domain-containing protein n=1 Tax=Halobacillus sp. Marseille-Q1614 TaxID=2709134 RepID=UPI00156E2FFA|nr:thioredoxin domain-containing protein [Halobacillus sp. Marseille-Q1614]